MPTKSHTIAASAASAQSLLLTHSSFNAMPSVYKALTRSPSTICILEEVMINVCSLCGVQCVLQTASTPVAEALLPSHSLSFRHSSESKLPKHQIHHIIIHRKAFTRSAVAAATTAGRNIKHINVIQLISAQAKRIDKRKRGRAHTQMQKPTQSLSLSLSNAFTWSMHTRDRGNK